VRPALVSGGLELHAPGRNPLEVERPAVATHDGFAHLGEPIRVGDGGDEAARWFSDLLGLDCRLVAIAPGYARRLPERFAIFDREVALGDAAPVLVVNETSFEDLRARASEPFGVERFRPNVVVRVDPAWTEDSWVTFRVGGAELSAGAPWPRCTVPQIDQDRGERRREPAVVLKEHRWCTDASGAGPMLAGLLPGNALFGIGCAIGPVGGVISVGDPVVVGATADPVLLPPPPRAGVSQ